MSEPKLRGRPRPPAPEETASAVALVAELRASLAQSPAALGRARFRGGLLLADQAVVAELAAIRPVDLSAVLNNRAPSSLSVAAILERLRHLRALQEEGILADVAEDRRARLVPFPG